MEHHWVSLLPFLIVIPVAMITRQVLPGLFAGLLTGCYLLKPSLFGGIKELVILVMDGLKDGTNLKIVLFLYSFSGLIGIIKQSGGIRGFVEEASTRIKTKKGALALTYLSAIGTFTAPSFRFVTIAPIMRALLKKIKMSTQELGFVIETTATPLIVLIPVATAFVGYMTSIVDMSLENEHLSANAYRLFISSIPFNFFSFVMILLGLYLSFFHRSSSQPMSEKEDVQSEEKEEDWHTCDPAVHQDLPSKPWNLLFPLIVLLFFIFLLTWWDGHSHATSFIGAFVKADVLRVMVMALIVTLIVSIVFYRLQGMKIASLMEGFIQGGNELMSVIVLLAVVWGLSATTDHLGFSGFITAHTGWIPHAFVPAALFVFGSAVSYFIGSSWGTWGILMPLGISLSQATGVSMPLVIGAVFASGTFGAFASPLSDDTNTIARILNLPVLEYARYKLKPALIAAGISTVLYGLTFLMT
ncbi:Na+/H+ antiporter NhaC-like protein [Fictibacillus macauensis ZFHKF-1]|uniref:Na+/H+ antiporter NhaC-like protein n=1 Tax=Fictibacillus macauensis ZFHKF-1 TaxID=1196324 RepID=I8ALQ5_9BACL|nr:Na+/H+ antiporter NhaC family protein [Fictibacillus macauensis]EIT86857.1 Na+/H+ antiporter NhaC-like protein [Fictibacillus macauensis ZFHKF-1]